jgi:transposase-like protein
MATEPSTLKEAIIHFADADNCIAYLVARRWPDGVVTCPTCGRKNPRYIAERKVWQCSIKHPKRQFSIKVGTIFEDSPLGLDKWLPAVWLLSNCKNGISSYEIERDLGVTQKTAWFMLSRIRLGLQSEDGGKLSGEVEVDETFIGGKNKNRHSDKRRSGRGTVGKEAVIGAVERNGSVVARVLEGIDSETLQAFVRETVSTKVSLLATDEYRGYWGLKEYPHAYVRHSTGEYVAGAIHTNTIEGFWSLIKRGIVGSFHKVSAKYLPLYVAEFQFRFNNRKNPDIFGEAIRGC